MLEFSAEQNWCDTDNDHFRSAVRMRIPTKADIVSDRLRTAFR
jgi:hypothetical protein